VYRNTDPNKYELFTVFRDGRVHTLNDFYTLEYRTFGDYVVYVLKDKHFNREVAEVLVKVESEFVMR
jgi:ATP-dependent Clp protease adapter protein ClpS